MIRRILLLAALGVASAAPAMAQSTFELLETVSETMNQMMNEAFIAEIPALEGRMPDPAWDDTLRDAYRCMYDGYVAEVGEEAVAGMVTAMEDQIDTLTPEQVMQGGPVDNPEGLSDERAVEIVNGCGLVEIFMTRMAESGAMEIMMQQ